MATKKKSPAKNKKSGTKKVGAVKINAYSPMIQLAAVGIGILAAKPINAAIDKVVNGKVDNKIVAGGQVGIGTTLVLVKFGKKRTPIDLIPVGIGGTLAGSGLVRAYYEFVDQTTVAGYQNVPVLGRSSMNGYQNVPVLGKSSMNGYIPGNPVNGFNVPMPVHKQVMGNASGSGLMATAGSEMMG